MDMLLPQNHLKMFPINLLVLANMLSKFHNRHININWVPLFQLLLLHHWALWFTIQQTGKEIISLQLMAKLLLLYLKGLFLVFCIIALVLDNSAKFMVVESKLIWFVVKANNLIFKLGTANMSSVAAENVAKTILKSFGKEIVSLKWNQMRISAKSKDNLNVEKTWWKLLVTTYLLL